MSDSEVFRPRLRARAVSFIQFVHALEFMALTPLFVWMAVDFDVPATYAGYAASAYMGGAALSGLLAVRWMHRAALKPLLLLALILLAVLSALGAISSEFGLFILLRLGAGLLGGFLMSAAMTLLLNGMNAELRTDAIAIVVSAFALVSIAGMPATLFIAVELGWRIALMTLAVLCLLAAAIAHRYLPSNQLVAAQPSQLALGKEAWRWLSLPAIAQAGSLLLIPVLIPILELRYDTQAQQMPVIFMLGGVAALTASRLSATGIKTWGETRISDLGTLILLLSLVMLALGWGTAYGFMILFMIGSYSRLVCASACSASYPTQARRGRFMALQTTSNHIGSFIALAVPSLLLGTLNVSLSTLNVLLLLTALVALALPVLMRGAAAKPCMRDDQMRTIDH
ncbi:MFS transporter [Alcaligenes phenolicus]|uniref:MFS transporter n=1 Tax=Alcaligenes phenolicus TaxID=232846 RepID=A0AAW5W052_9BURK|nr:MFS transporter [Alcaligenes phenolicus]MCX5567020.1 MFS transporter [Alcaligenes phenolicus]